MRKFATLAATALCAGTALAGGASAARAHVSVGPDGPGTTADPAQVLTSVGFANGFCGAPWTWAGQQPNTGCAAAQPHNAPTQQ